MNRKTFCKYLALVLGANCLLYVGYSFHKCSCRDGRTVMQANSSVHQVSTTPLPGSSTEKLNTGPAILDAEAPASEARVFRWDGASWKRQVGFCSGNYTFRRVSLQTPAGPTPIYVYDDVTDKWVSAAIAKAGSWDYGNVKMTVDKLNALPDSMFLDLGAQLGTFSLSAARSGRRVVAVDPLLENVLRLCRSLQDGGLAHLVTVLYVALSDSRGTVAFQREPGNVGGTRVVKLARASDVNDPNIMETVLLDDIIPFITTKNVFVKMDVETHEHEVLSGGKEFLRRFSHPDILMEFLHHRSNPAKAGQLLNFLKEQNYTAVNGATPGLNLDPGNYRNWPADIVLTKRK